MGGSTRQTQTTTSQSEKRPWAPTIPLLHDIIGKAGALAGNTGLSDVERNALDALARNAQAGNPYAGRIGMLADELFGGGRDRSGLVESAYRDYGSALAPFARGEYVNPASNPALRGYLDVISGDVSNRVNSLFAGAGRDLSGAHQGAIARGIAEGTAPVLAGQYNADVNRQLGAINSLYGAGNTTAGLLSGLDQTALGNRQAGVNVAGAAMQAANDPLTRLLAIEQQRRGIPQQNLGMLANLLVPLAQLGGTQNSQGVNTSETTEPLFKQITEGLGKLGGLGNLAKLAPLFSDERVKRDIRPVGMLNDGLPLYRFRYAGDPAVRVGLMAQDVEQVDPGAVHNVGGIKAVDYDRATRRAATVPLPLSRSNSRTRVTRVTTRGARKR
jgi:hypothetical protein